MRYFLAWARRGAGPGNEDLESIETPLLPMYYPGATLALL